MRGVDPAGQELDQLGFVGLESLEQVVGWRGGCFKMQLVAVYREFNTRLPGLDKRNSGLFISHRQRGFLCSLPGIPLLHPVGPVGCSVHAGFRRFSIR